MKNILLILLVSLLVYLATSLYFVDKCYFLCPVKYTKGLIIRSDSRGDGVFAAGRSGRRIHKGLDLLAAPDTPVLASRSGRVVAATQNNGMGKYVIIRHSGNINTLYGHLSRIYVSQGQFLRQGAVIGCVGKTGNANYPDIEPHLHFEVRENGISKDPLEYLQ